MMSPVGPPNMYKWLFVLGDAGMDLRYFTMTAGHAQ